MVSGMKVNKEFILRSLAFVLAGGIGLSSACSAQSSRLAPVFDGLGDHHHPVTTRSSLGQRYFDQGLTLLYGFNHAEAVRSFQALAELDPGCAMAWWGVALAHGPNINRPMEKSDVPRAWEALQKALALKPKASAKERAYIDALAQRYEPKWSDDRSALDQAYADAMRQVARDHPDDLDAATLFAEALMDTMPWDYWTKDRTPKPATRELLAELRRVRQRNPNHPGANHFWIHAVEAGPNPEHGLPAAERLSKFCAQAGHLVHMPSHIYVRVGQYHDASEANYRAQEADRAYISHCRIQGFYSGVYYPHNMHFLWYATSLEGRSAEAMKAAEKVAEYAFDPRCGTTVIEAPRFRHLPLLVCARFGLWDKILQARPGVATELLDQAMTHYARGLAHLNRNQPEQAQSELNQLEKIAASNEAKKLDTPILPATGIMKVARHVLAGKLAGHRGNNDQCVEELEKAVVAEDALPYMEPPFWYYPVRQSLGAAWLRLDQPSKAEAVFREDLERLPRNGWSLFGLEESLRRQGKEQAAAAVHREFAAAWKHADVKLDLSAF